MDVPRSTWNHCLEHAALSDVGHRRANNQDAYAVVLADNQTDFERRGHFFMVADGMGAHAAGELASKMAVDAVSLVYRKRLDQSPHEAILSAVLDANQQIHSRGLASPDFRGMGTTATTLVLLPEGAIVAHVGDSRAYRVRGPRIEQLTFDHSLVWEIRAAGNMPDAELPAYISKNIITRSLGPNPAVQVDLEGPYPLEAGDTFLLCSDGLSGQVNDDEIGMVLSCLPPADAVQALVDLANLRGGPDNITAVVVRVLGPQVAQAVNSKSSEGKTFRAVRPVHPLVWTVMGVASLAAVGLLTLGHPLIALLGVLAAAAAAIVAIVQRYGVASRCLTGDGRRFGRGPYTECQCVANADLLARLLDIIQQIRDAATQENWPIEWAAFERLLAQGASATQAGNLADAAREYLHAITFLMDQLRRHRDASSDSGPPPSSGAGSHV